MHFGALAPLPLRLGDPVSAEAHARLAANQTAVVRTSPFAMLRVTLVDPVATVDSFRSMAGHGSSLAPSIAGSSGTLVLTFPQFYEDDYGQKRFLRLQAATATALGGTALAATAEVQFATQSTVTIRLYAAGGGLSNGSACVTVY